MSNYSPIVNYAAKDALSSGDPLKRIKGTEISAEFTAIATMSATKADLASPTFTGTPSAPTAAAGTNTTQLATTAFSYLSIANLITGITGVNGWILSAANTPALYSNSVQRATVNATGNFVLNAPSAGVAATLNGFSGANVLALVAPASANLLTATDGTCSGIWFFQAAAGSIFGHTSNHALQFYTNNTSRVTIAAAGNVTIAAPSSGTPITVNGGKILAIGVSAGAAAAIALQNNGNSRVWRLTNGNASESDGTLILTEDIGGRSILTVLPAGNVAVLAPSSGIALTVAGVSGTHSTKIADSATNSFNAGFLEAPQNSQAANYTTVLSDSGKHLYHSGGVAHTHTIDSNANVPYPLGTVLTFINENGAANLTIALTSDTLRFAPGGTTGSRTLAANGRATAIKVTSTGWQISGTNLT